jgi:cystathionine beta-lyase/cystathionine gamma-synthase
MSWVEGKSLWKSGKQLRLLTSTRLILNPKAQNYALLKKIWDSDYVDNHWAEDSIFLERNSRDFVSRIERIGINAEAICDVLTSHPRGNFYPTSLQPANTY